MTKVLIVDDDAFTRANLRTILAAKGLTVVAEAEDGDQVPAAIAEHRPDVVLIDLRMRRVGGVQAIRQAAGQPDAPHFIALTAIDTEDVLDEAIKAGAAGFAYKDDAPEDLAGHIRAVAAGDGALSASAAAIMIRRTKAGTGRSVDRVTEARERLALLTDKEREVAALVELTNVEIAPRLHMAPDTVKAHVSSALSKLGLRNRQQLAVLADRAGLGTPAGNEPTGPAATPR